MTIKKEKLKVSDMTCISCEKRIEKELTKINGVINAIASYKDSSVIVEYDDKLCNDDVIKTAITKAGYTVGGSFEAIKLLGILFIGLAIYFLGNYSSSFNMSSKLQEGTTLFVLFIVGIFTSIHCVGMCGGIMLSQSISSESGSRLKAFKPTLLYNAGRVVSYTILGGVVGAIGSVLSISLSVKAGISIFAGLFMIVMGLNMSGFSLFKKLNIRMPWSFCSVKTKARTPFIVGLLNGLLPCGPLQTMQLYALGTGSFVKGALSMFIFSIGTVPLMLTFGLLTGFLSKGFTKSILKLSGILVLVLGFIMANRGLALAGVKPITVNNILSAFSTQKSIPANATAANKAELKDGVQIIRMTADANGYSPNVFFVQKGIPVKWIIDGKEITSCNNQIVIPSLNQQKDLVSGENTIEFTPKDTSDISFSCWMGMKNGIIKVVDNLGTYDTSKANVSVPSSGGMSCCGGGGGGSATPAQKPSIYGNDISKVLSTRLVKVANPDSNSQQIDIKGIGYEFDPLIIVVKENLKTTIDYDLKKFDTPEGVYTIIDGSTGKELLATDGSKNSLELNYTFTKQGSYLILKDGQIINIIKAVKSTKNIDYDAIRHEFLQQ